MNRLLKNAQNRLLARAAQKTLRVFARSYRAATAREQLSSAVFQHPVKPTFQMTDT
jgi:hypothetical protein